MRYRMSCVVLIWLFATVGAWAQVTTDSPTVRAVPLYEQCKPQVSASKTTPVAVAALNDKDPQKRVEAARSLAKACDTQATEALMSAFRDENLAVRVAAVEALGQLGGEEAIDPLVESIPDQEWQVRSRAHPLDMTERHRAAKQKEQTSRHCGSWSLVSRPAKVSR